MNHAVSISEAKNRLPARVHEAERHPIVLLRRGQPVGVLLSHEQYKTLCGRRVDTWEALQGFCDEHNVASLQLDGVLADVRDSSSPRTFHW